jgi:adenylate kinase
MLGAPGAGKGTHGNLISKKLGIPKISTGDVFRHHIEEGTELGLKAKEYMDKGLLVPDDIVMDIVDWRLNHGDCHKGFIFDGFPRTIAQAEHLDKILAEKGEPLVRAINLEVDDDVIIDRMKNRRVCPKCGATYNILHIEEEICDECGTALIIREDDEEHTVRKRIVEYHKKSQPLIDYYEEQGILFRVKGNEGITHAQEEIFKDLEK